MRAWVVLILLLVVGCTDTPTTTSPSKESSEHITLLSETSFKLNDILEKNYTITEDEFEKLSQQVQELDDNGYDVTGLLERMEIIKRNSETLSGGYATQSETKSSSESYSKSGKSESGYKGKSVRGQGHAELVGVDDGVAAWLSKDIVYQVIDISNPSKPSLSGTIDTEGFATTVYQDGGRVYLAGNELLVIRSVDDPLGEDLGVYDYGDHGYWPAVITVDEGYAYLSQGGDLLILDITDPVAVKEVSFIETEGTAPTQIVVENSYVFIVASIGGIVVVDVRDLQNPKEVALHPFESHTTGFVIRGSYAYLARVDSLKTTDSNAGYEFASVFEVIDISDPTTLDVVSTLTIPTNLKGLDIEGNYAYLTGSYPHRFTAVDITNPKNPKTITSQGLVDTSGALKGLSVQNGYAYLLDSGFGLRVLDLKNPSAPVQVANVELNQMLSRMAVSDNAVYLVAEQRYFNVADVSDPDNPVFAHSIKVPSGSYPYTSIVVEDGIAFSNAYHSAVYDLKDPYNPKQLNVDIGIDGVDVRDDLLYTVIGEIGLNVYDISNLESPMLLSTTGFAQGMCRDFSLNQNWLVCVANKPYSINVMDVSNPSKPVAKGTHVFDKYAMSVTVKDDHVYVAQGEGGLDIFRIESEGSLEFLTNHPDNVHRVIVEGNRAYVLGGSILDISNPSKPIKIGETPSEDVTSQAKIQDGYMYMASGEKGLTVVPIDKALK